MSLLFDLGTGASVKMAEKSRESHFRVIIVGGSVAGLTLANALSRKDIDFLVLETREMVTTHTGAAVCLVSNGTRILDQMGMLDEISEATMPLKAFYTWRANGKLLRKLYTPEILQTR
jgi:2-polyprenyl-6-methoxyphenol hydroxylase-like FAD-dependent oxidoreductase